MRGALTACRTVRSYDHCCVHLCRFFVWPQEEWKWAYDSHKKEYWHKRDGQFYLPAEGHDGLVKKETERAIGHVAMWNTKKGFGYIKPDADPEHDVFAHRTALDVYSINSTESQIGPKF